MAKQPFPFKGKDEATTEKAGKGTKTKPVKDKKIKPTKAKQLWL